MKYKNQFLGATFLCFSVLFLVKAAFEPQEHKPGPFIPSAKTLAKQLDDVPPFYSNIAKSEIDKRMGKQVSKVEKTLAKGKKPDKKKKKSKKKKPKAPADKKKPEKKIDEKKLPIQMLDALSHAYSDPELTNKKISLRTKPVPIVDAINLIGRLAQLEFQIDSDVTGTTGQINCSDCSVGNILHFINETNNPRLAMMKFLNTWRIMRLDKAIKLIEEKQQNDFLVKVFQIKHSNLDDERVKKIKKMWKYIVADTKGARSYLMFDRDSRKIFAHGLRQHIDELGFFLNEVDKSLPQVRIDVVFVVTQKGNLFSFGFNWSGVYNRQATLARRGTRFGLAGLGAALREHPTPATGTDASGDALSNTNLLIDPLNFALNLVKQAHPIHIPFIFGGSNLNTRRLNLILDAEESCSRAKILARPSVLTVDGQLADLLIGTSIPITTIVEDSVEGKVRNVQTVTYKDVGVSLKVRPTVRFGKKLIELDIFIQGTEIAGSLKDEIDSSGTVSGGQAPVIATTRTKNRVVLRSGQTTVIAGLIRKSNKRINSSVPFLSQLPIIGFLFRRQEIEDIEDEQLIFITPTLIENGEEV